MRRITLGLLVVVGALFAWPTAPRAWGFEGHRLITGWAIDAMPPPARALFQSKRAFVVEHSVDPDTWRTVGLRTDFGAESVNHFLDIDALDERAPFTGVPREWDAFVARYGAEKANRMGRLPWRIEEVYGRLVTALKGIATNTPYALSNAQYIGAVLAHYVEDAHQPFHAIENHDGQLTNQLGLHLRWEATMGDRLLPTMRRKPGALVPVPDIKAFVFARLAESAVLTPRILDADRTAAASRPRSVDGRPAYDAAYFAALTARTRDIYEARANAAADAVASVFMAAWAEAGKPEVPAGR